MINSNQITEYIHKSVTIHSTLQLRNDGKSLTGESRVSNMQPSGGDLSTTSQCRKTKDGKFNF